MTSSDYRTRARMDLQGKWTTAVLAGLVAGLLGGLVTGSLGMDFEIDAEHLASLPRFVRTYFAIAAGIGGILALVQFIIGGAVQLGYCRFLMNMHDGKEANVSDVFSQMDRFGDGFCLALLKGIYTFLWSLLFIIPGIIAAYKYSMASFIMSENPDITPNQAITASKELMDGNKMDLFLLELSFIGWGLLNILTLGIGSLWLNPYMNAAHAAFYRNISRPAIRYYFAEQYN